jgi:acyl-CoA synthetase (AMP-forming)/AMP-acid ligase II
VAGWRQHELVHKRKLTPYQRQIRFFTVFFGALMIGAVVVVLWLLNHRMPGDR